MDFYSVERMVQMVLSNIETKECKYYIHDYDGDIILLCVTDTSPLDSNKHLNSSKKISLINCLRFNTFFLSTEISRVLSYEKEVLAPINNEFNVSQCYILSILREIFIEAIERRRSQKLNSLGEDFNKKIEAVFNNIVIDLI